MARATAELSSEAHAHPYTARNATTTLASPNPMPRTHRRHLLPDLTRLRRLTGEPPSDQTLACAAGAYRRPWWATSGPPGRRRVGCRGEVDRLRATSMMIAQGRRPSVITPPLRSPWPRPPGRTRPA